MPFPALKDRAKFTASLRDDAQDTILCLEFGHTARLGQGDKCHLHPTNILPRWGRSVATRRRQSCKVRVGIFHTFYATVAAAKPRKDGEVRRILHTF
jgi:hypothetical protein